MTPPWFRPLSLFIVFNMVVVPITDRLAWDGMLQLTASHGPLAGVGLSLAAAAAILVANILIYNYARSSGLPGLGQMVLFVLIAVTFALPIGTGRFSPVNLIIDLLS